MRVAIAGLGGATTRGHLPALATLAAEGKVAIVGGCDPDPARREAVRRALPALPLFATATELLSVVQPELFVIAAHPAAHGELATLAAAHDLHVLCEKPAGVNADQVAAFSALARRASRRALVAVYQYRYSQPWRMAATLLRAVTAGESCSLSVDVQRRGTDRHASSRWRDDPAAGGALADHTVHFLALARELLGPLRAVAATRAYDRHAHEWARARVLAGSGRVDIAVGYGAPRRATSVVLTAGASTLRWAGGTMSLERAGRPTQWHRVAALSDRRYVDALYLPLYRNLLAGLHDPSWRQDRARELVEVGEVLVALVAAADEDHIALMPSPAAA